MKTKIFLPILMLICISWNVSNGAIYHRYLGTLMTAEFVNLCAGPNDSLVLHKPAASHTNCRFYDPDWNMYLGDTVIITYAQQGNWYFSSAEVGNDIYVYFIQGLPTQPADMAHDSVFAQGTININWTLDAENLTSGYSCTYLWDDSSTSKYRTITDTGTYWLRITNDCGSRTDTIHVTIYDPTTYVVNYDGQKSFACRVYPNPANRTDRLTLEMATTDFQVQLLTPLGQVLLSEPNAKTLDISNIPRGLYLIQVAIDGKVNIQKLIIN